MRKISRKTYDRMDNGVYDSKASEWWQPDSPFYQMKVSFNPARVGYLRRKLLDELRIDPGATAALDVGCGGGFMTEEVARMGFDTTGVDPSERSLQAAAAHARDSRLRIRYVGGVAESLPFEDGSFGAVFCCDVLEHVRDLPKAIAEISRVLKPGGTFCYDTLNRTWLSLLAAIKIGQEWKRWAFMPPDLHVWRMFIKPRELRSLLGRNGLLWMDHRGLAPNAPVLRVLRDLRKRAEGAWTYRELAARIHMVESRVTAVMYIGTAVKNHRIGVAAEAATEERVHG